MALAVSSVATNAATSTSWVAGSLSFTAGEMIIVSVTNNSNGSGQQISSVADDSGSGSWVPITDSAALNFDVVWWCKKANGSETEITVSFTTNIAYDGIIAKITGATGELTLEDTDENETYIASASSSPIAGGSVTNTTASAVALVLAASDGAGTIETSRAVSDGASYSEVAQTGATIYLFAHVKSSTSTYSPSFSYSDTGDEAYVASAIFGDVAGGGGGFQPAWARGSNVLLKAA